MDGLILYLILAFFVVMNLVLGLVVLRADSKSATNRLFAGFILSVLAWLATNAVADASATASLVTIWTKITMASAASISWLLLMFTSVFPTNEKLSRKTIILLTIPYVLVALLSLFTDQVIKSAVSVDNVTQVTFGNLIILYAAFLLVYACSSVWILIRKFKHSTGIARAQIAYFLLGLTLFIVSALTTNLILPVVFQVFYLTPFGSLTTGFLLGFTAYAIVKHGLFNIKVILAQIAVVSLVLVNGIQLFESDSVGNLALRSAGFILVAGFGYLFVRSVVNEVRRREQIEILAQEKTKALAELEQRNKNLATLQQISDIVLNENDTKAMTQKILDELPKQLDSCVGGLLSIAKDGKLTAYAITQNNMAKKVISMIGGSLEKYNFPIKKEYNRIHEALVDKKSIDSDSLTDFISPPIPKAVAASIQTLIGAKHVEVFPLYAGGEPLGVMLFVFNRPGAEVHDKNYAIAKAISDDLSLAVQRAQAFEQLKAANEYLAQLDKMKDEFISMASHELNTPLAAIEGYLSMILDEGMGKIDKQSRTYLNRAYASSKRLAELILDLLNVSRIEQGRLKMKYEQIAIAEMVESVIHELQIKADGKKIYLKMDITKDLPKIWCDPDRIREVIVNLTGNAIKFTDKGGITIKASQPDPKSIRIQVVDTGRGIAKEDQAKLFQKFSQVKREVDEHQGSGLGLYISKNFVELHSGKIWVDSETGKGATFSFELPLIQEPPKEVRGAVLEGPLDSPRIEQGNPLEVPAGIKESVKKT